MCIQQLFSDLHTLPAKHLRQEETGQETGKLWEHLCPSAAWPTSSPRQTRPKRNAAKSVLGNTKNKSDKIRDHPLEEQDQQATCTYKRRKCPSVHVGACDPPRLGSRGRIAVNLRPIFLHGQFHHSQGYLVRLCLNYKRKNIQCY